MNPIVKLVLLGGVAIVAQGCMTPQAYVDPAYRKATFETVKRSPTPTPVRVQVEFQRNGKALPAADKLFRSNVERVLKESGVFAPTSDVNSAATFSMVGNNIADLAAARSKGFKTGLTFGGKGTMVDDNYEFSCTYKAANGTKESKFQHAIHSAFGHTNERPPGLTPTSVNEAFSRVVDDVVLNCIKELQDANLVAK